MVPLALFRNRNFAGGSLSLVLVQIANGGLLLAMTQYLQFVLDYTPTETGLAMIPMAVAVIITNSFSATLGQKIGNRAMTVAGLLVLAGGFGFFSTMSADDGFATVALALVVFGVGAGLAQPAAVTALMGAVPAEHAGVGSALNDTVQQAGAALGVAILGSVLVTNFADAMPADAPEPARASIADAIGTAAATGDGALATAAREAFASGMSTTFVIGAIGVLAAAILALVVMKDRKAGAVEVVAEPVAVH